MPYELLEKPLTDQGESLLGLLGRTGARTAARVLEAVAGLPGDIASGALNLANYGISKVTGQQGPLPSRASIDLPSLFPFPMGIAANVGGKALESITGQPTPTQIPIPTSEDIKQHVTEPLTGEYLKPQGDMEKFYDDIIGDAATIFMPVKGKLPFAKATLGALGKATAGNVAQWAAEKVSDSPIVGVAAKMGAMALAGTFGGRKELSTVKDKSYKEAFSKIPEGAKFDLSPEKARIDRLVKTISKGDRPDRDFLIDRLSSFGNISDKKGKAGIQEAITLKQDWNKHLADPGMSKSTRDIMKQAVGTVNKGISRYGVDNPSFYQPYKMGEELTGALNGSNYVQKFLDKFPSLQNSVKNPLLQKIFYGGLGYGAIKSMSIPQIAVGTGTAMGAYHSAKMYQLLSKSPVARRYYKDVVQSAFKNDVKATARNLSKLDHAANDFMQKYPDLMPEGKEGESTGRYELLS
jgi:hypothetical protein